MRLLCFPPSGPAAAVPRAGGHRKPPSRWCRPLRPNGEAEPLPDGIHGRGGRAVRGPPTRRPPCRVPRGHTGKAGHVAQSQSPARGKSVLPPSCLFTAASVHVEVFEMLLLETERVTESP